jgi:hypothetical protein
MKHSKEMLERAVSASTSVAQVLRYLGYKTLDGGTHSHITRRLRFYGINTSHFFGKGANRGERHKGGPRKLSWQEILIAGRLLHKEHTPTLRRAMIESGIEHRCGTCGMQPFWNGKELVLQISHKNGKSSDNRKENLGFECPNCHSQTEDFGGRSAGKKN